MKRVLGLLYGATAYFFFLGTFVYAIGFVGNIGVPKDVDAGTLSPTLTAVLIDVLLLGVFAVQHSVMARRSFKRQWTRLVSPYMERSSYVLAATSALALLLWQWRPIPGVVWDFTGTPAEVVLRAAFFLGWIVLLVATFLVSHFELFGLQQVWAYFQGRDLRHAAFRTPGLYRMVRHPIYLGFVIGFWATPFMTMGHLLLAAATTGYILVGIAFEERDLIAAYGQAYRDYRKRVPMLLPLPKSVKPAPAAETSNA